MKYKNMQQNHITLVPNFFKILCIVYFSKVTAKQNNRQSNKYENTETNRHAKRPGCQFVSWNYRINLPFWEKYRWRRSNQFSSMKTIEYVNSLTNRNRMTTSWRVLPDIVKCFSICCILTSSVSEFFTSIAVWTLTSLLFAVGGGGGNVIVFILIISARKDSCGKVCFHRRVSVRGEGRVRYFWSQVPSWG